MKKYQDGGKTKDAPLFDYDQFMHGISYVESNNGKYMKNPHSSATGLYGQLYSTIDKDFLKERGIDSRDAFAADTAHQNDYMRRAMYGDMSNTDRKTNYVRDVRDLTKEYKPQLKDKFTYRPDEIAALAHFLGRQGTRDKFGSIRDGSHYMPPGVNKSPEEYLKLYNEGLSMYKDGGAVKGKSPGTFDITFDDKTLNVEVASDPVTRRKGLSKREIGDNASMLFVFAKPGKHQMWMKDTSSDLDIIHMNEGGVVTEVSTAVAQSDDMIGSKEDTKYVLEIPAGLAVKYGIEPGDELDIPKEFHGALDDEDSSMILLDDEGNHQMDLKGGERIFSRKKTKEMVDSAKQARTEKDLSMLGKIVAEEIIAQDSRDPEYVKNQEQNVAYAADGTRLRKITRFPELGDMDITDLRNVVAKYGYTVNAL